MSDYSAKIVPNKKKTAPSAISSEFYLTCEMYECRSYIIKAINNVLLLKGQSLYFR